MVRFRICWGCYYPLRVEPLKGVGWTGDLKALYNGSMEDSGRMLRFLGIGLAIGIVVVAVWIGLMNRQPEQQQNKVKEVTIAREDMSITITRGGTLTVKIPEGTFQQQWDEERVAAFFAKFELEDFSVFAAYGDEVEGYTLTYTTESGEQFSFVLPFFDIPIPEVIEELVEALEEISGAVPTPIPTPTPTPIPIYSYPTPTPIPTPTPYIPPQPTPTPGPSNGDGDTGQKLFECEFTDPDVAPNILSQTICTLLYPY